MTSVTWDARNLPDTYVESLQKCHTTVAAPPPSTCVQVLACNSNFLSQKRVSGASTVNSPGKN